ncbi:MULTISPECIES: ABC transporter ATP-binding protein [Bradyrhizobium]|uniref:ABC transporter ATP-binding protein n=1 Tax=Bradyrhizobium TaxID=374 RepID=UPI001E5C2FDC|nr:MULTISPECIES: ABC transporter ATP-binding protein [Bradyrhizobium]
MSGASVSLRSVGKSFAGRTVLDGVDLEIAAGEFVSIIGPSGAGKSTLLRLVAGLDAPTRGRIELRATGHKADVRLMFQEDRLLPWRPVLGNVLLGIKGRKQDAGRILEAVGLQGRESEFPIGLSGGQRQRVALARALIHDRICCCSTSRSERSTPSPGAAMQLLLEQLLVARPRTVVLVTHDVEEALLLSDRVLLVKDGGIARDLSFDQPRPRHRGDPALSALKEELLDGLLTAERDLAAVA